MALCGLFAVALGYMAGLRFRIAIMLPLSMAAVVAMAVLVVIGWLGLGAACLNATIVTVALQSGYALALACPLPGRPQAHRHPVKA